MFVDGYCGATTEEAFDAVDPYLVEPPRTIRYSGNPASDSRSDLPAIARTRSAMA
jgi:hypothetical protein